tara:strand:- start:11 stop:367 length:357 start_codon:yes stop_codon:yes gene_type:complete
MTDKIKEIVKEKLSKKQWTFDEISNIADVVEELSDTCYDTLKAKGKVDLLWDVEIEDNLSFGQFFQALVKKTLKSEIAVIVKDELKEAVIQFKVNKNEVSKTSLGGQSLQKRSSDEKK